MPDLDLTTFVPKNADELLKGITGEAAKAAAGAWTNLKKVVSGDLKTLAENAFSTQKRLATGKIDQSEADFLIHMQELYLHQILLRSKLLLYAALQAVLNAVFGVIAAAVKNITGITVSFG